MNKYKVVFFLILTLLAIYSLYRTYSDVRIKAKTIDDLALSVEELKEDNKLFKQDIAQKKTRDFIEVEAVSKLGLAKANQDVIVIPKTSKSNVPVKVEEIIDNSKDFISQWKDLFLKNNPFRY